MPSGAHIKDAGVAVERRLTAEVRVQHPRARFDPAGADEVDQRRHRLPLVDRVGDHALEPGAEPDRVDRLPVRNPVRAGVPLVEQHDLVVAQLSIEPDRRRGATRDPRDLIPRLRNGRRPVDPEHAPLLVLQRKAGDHPGLRRAGDRADDDRVEEDVELALLVGDLLGPPREPVAAERMVGRTGRDRVRLAAPSLDVRERLLPLGRIPMSKPDESSRTSAPRIRESRMLPTRS